MISDRTLLRICIIISIIGIISLFFLSEPKSVYLIEVDDSMIGQVIDVSGSASSVSITENATFFILSDSSSSINVVSFSPLSINEFDNVSVTGKVDIYRGKIEIIANNVGII